ncbi:MAG: leucine--tRNA ligase [Candidatus Sungbacteria bacterium]|uniref:Leucine--tRNA ligase n=1 Tax=Candidatus Sungiibacteriota bacterium TaxID=2750080 RepID=A0A931SDR1_9BACT|nr:leucine--tRNA ligase [Candidatus Sungbacteria bacterium]
MRYNPKAIEAKWQKRWLETKTYEPKLKSAKKPVRQAHAKPFYNLMMFPYPSAEGLHVGNVYAFTGSDIYGRFQRMRGNDVFEPIGLDGFGIHSENYALKIGKHPAKQAKVSEKNFYRQLSQIGNGFAWREHLETYDPDYYKWTQWIFVQMFKKGLAYRKKAKVNWCPSCLTVLADEQVIQGRCERCETEVVKRDLEQWFFKITDYAERLLENLKTIDWSPKVKIAQAAWIGKSEGAELEFPVVTSDKRQETSIKVFTTRPDTLFGATYMVLAPEHPLIENLKLKIKNWEEVEDYIKKSAKKSEIERTAETKEKTGVELEGVKAVNPANQEEIPVFIADYVLASYGTGAIMAVPAHDQRDFAFAQKFNLSVWRVIRKKEAPIKSYLMGAKDVSDKELATLGISIIKKTSDGDRKIIVPKTKLSEYENLVSKKMTPGFWNEYIGEEAVFIFKHKDGSLERLTLTPETEKRIDKLAADFVGEGWSKSSVWKWLAENDWYADLIIHTDPGFLENSGKFDGLESEEAKWEITKFVGGEKKTQYRLRDWLISRQRYWGPPIPLVFCENCADKVRNQESRLRRSFGGQAGIRNIFNKGELENPGWIAVPEKDLPVKLPFVKNFRPTGTGQSPLASVKSFYETKCPKCGKTARRETDVSDTFLDSAWYYLRYPSIGMKNSKIKIKNDNGKYKIVEIPWSSEVTKKWLPVEMYIGGAEHSVLHLLYSRFLTMVFHDWGLLDFGEPFTTFRAHGLVIKDGAKMSKSKGNIVNPDDYIKAYGADALRLYLMFMGPFQDGGDFRDSGIAGLTRFLNRVWKFFSEKSKVKNQKLKIQAESQNLERILHRTVKKVTADIESLRYNTAISSLMMLLNEFEAAPDAVSLEGQKIFLKLLAPFAPHMTEELWSHLKEKGSIHKSAWPVFDPRLIREETFELVVQVNGKMRGKILLPQGVSQADAEKAAKTDPRLRSMLGGIATRKVIFVPGRLINFVI